MVEVVVVLIFDNRSFDWKKNSVASITVTITIPAPIATVYRNCRFLAI
jgi:hypothetical protein